MPTQIMGGTQSAILNTEHSLWNSTTPGEYELVIDATNMANGDELEWYAKEKVLSGSTAVVGDFRACAHAQVEKTKRLRIAIVHYGEFCIKQTAGTGRSFDWSVRRVDDGMGSVASVSGAVASVTTVSDKTGYALTSGERTSIADAVLDRTDGIETGLPLRQALRAVVAALAGKISGAEGTTITIRNTVDNKNRIIATVDSYGNRTAITYDLT